MKSEEKACNLCILDRTEIEIIDVFKNISESERLERLDTYSNADSSKQRTATGNLVICQC